MPADAEGQVADRWSKLRHQRRRVPALPCVVALAEAGRDARGRFRNACEFAVWASKGSLPLDRNVSVLSGLVTAPPVPRTGRKHVAEKPLP